MWRRIILCQWLFSLQFQGCQLKSVNWDQSHHQGISIARKLKKEKTRSIKLLADRTSSLVGGPRSPHVYGQKRSLFLAKSNVHQIFDTLDLSLPSNCYVTSNLAVSYNHSFIPSLSHYKQFLLSIVAKKDLPPKVQGEYFFLLLLLR